MSEFTPYQQKVIKRYYDSADTVALQRLAELVTDLYLEEGKKRDRSWKQAVTHMQKLGVPQSRIDHLLSKADVQLLANLVTELQGSK
jgi:hypothetical protein